LLGLLWPLSSRNRRQVQLAGVSFVAIIVATSVHAALVMAWPPYRVLGPKTDRLTAARFPGRPASGMLLLGPCGPGENRVARSWWTARDHQPGELSRVSEAVMDVGNGIVGPVLLVTLCIMVFFAFAAHRTIRSGSNVTRREIAYLLLPTLFPVAVLGLGAAFREYWIDRPSGLLGPDVLALACAVATLPACSMVVVRLRRHRLLALGATILILWLTLFAALAATVLFLGDIS
jgi:hypothetical protein